MVVRFWSLADDSIGVKGAILGIVVAATFYFLFLNPVIFG
jgi:hypothetical protein